MGGRGGSSGLSNNEFTNSEINSLTESAIDFIKKNERIYGTMTSYHEENYRSEIKSMYKKGWNGLEDGRVLDVKGRQYLVKDGNNAALYLFRSSDFQSNLHIEEGMVSGRKGEKIKSTPLSLDQRKIFLRKAIFLKLLPRTK